MSVEAYSDETPLGPDDELLVSYLDGELEPTDRGELEHRLVDDLTLRSRLQELQRGWSLLDDFPAAVDDERLVESTLELVVADVVKIPAASQSFWGRHRQKMLYLGGVILAVGVTAAAVTQIRSNYFRRTLDSLTIAEYLDGYIWGDDLDLMRELNSNTKFRNMISAAREVGAIRYTDESIIAHVPVDEREQAIAMMDDEQRTLLSARWATFDNMVPRERGKIRDLHELVELQPDAERLRQTMNAYAAWRNTLSDEQINRMERPEPSEGVSRVQSQRNAIDDAIASTMGQLTRSSSKLLTSETVDHINETLRMLVTERLALGDEGLFSLHQILNNNRGGGELSADEILDTLALAIARAGRSRGPRGPGPGSGRGPDPGGGPGGRRNSFGAIDPLSDDELWEIEASVEGKDLASLNTLSSGIDAVRLLVLAEWAFEASESLKPWADNSSPLEKYNQLDQDEREKMDLAEPDEFLREFNRPSGPPGSSRPSGPR